MRELTELEKVMLRKIKRFQKEMALMEDLIINGVEEVEKPQPKKIEKYNPANDLSFFNDADFQTVWGEYMTIRIRKKASNTDRAIKAIINKIIKLSKNNKAYALQMVDRSVNSGWTDVWELKDYVVKVSEKKGTNTERYNFRKDFEENPEEYTEFNMNDIFKIKKV